MARPALITVDAPAIHHNRPFFARATGRAFESRDADGATVIDLYDEIGAYGVSAKDMRARLADAGDVVLRINSPGGSVFDGIAMFNDLVAHTGRIRVEIVGLAASAASLVAMAGDEIAIAENGFVMIHQAWTLAAGNASGLTEVAAVLVQVDQSLAATYAARSEQSVSAVASMMAAETWMTADAAIESGFADATLPARGPQARFDLSVFARAPAALAADIPRDNPTIRDVETALRDAGLSRSQAKALAAHGHRGVTDEQREAAEIADLDAHIRAIALRFT